VPWFEVNSVPHFGRRAGWSFSDYLHDYASTARAVPKVPLAGPDVGAPGWVAGLGRFLSSQPRVRIATVHRYALGCIPSKPATIAGILSDRSTRDFGAGLGSAVAAAHAHGLPLRLDEMNTVSCGGQAGVSDTFAAALWALDVQFELASEGFGGVNVHSKVGIANQLFSFRRVDAAWEGHVAPEYYGLLAFAQAAPAGSRLVPVRGVPDGPVHVWATRGPDGSERVVLINMATRGGRTVAVLGGSRDEPATLERLSAPRAGATAGVTLGGRSFGKETTTGTLAGRPRAVSVKRSGSGAYQVWMPAASAAILTLTPRGR